MLVKSIVNLQRAASTSKTGRQGVCPHRSLISTVGLQSATIINQNRHSSKQLRSICCARRVRGPHSAAKNQSAVSTSGRSDVWHENSRLTSADILRDTVTSANASVADSSDLLRTLLTAQPLDDVALRKQGCEAMLTSSATLASSTYTDRGRQRSCEDLQGSGHIHFEGGSWRLSSTTGTSALESVDNDTLGATWTVEANQSQVSGVVVGGVGGVEAEGSASHTGAR